MGGFLRQYFIIAFAIGLALLGAGLVAALKPGFNARVIEQLINFWWMLLVLVGPIPVLVHQHGRVKAGTRSVTSAVARVAAAAIVANVFALAGVVGAIYLGQRLNLALFYGDAGLAILGMYAAAVAVPLIAAVLTFVACREARP